MKVLLDENLPHELRLFLVGHDVFTVTFMQWSGVSNGALRAVAAAQGFDVLLTNDANIGHQRDRQYFAVVDSGA